MIKAASWTGVEVDGDLRDAARRAARRAGLSLGDWLDGLMEARAQDLGVTVADLGAEDCFAAVTERLAQGDENRPAAFRSADRVLAAFGEDRQRTRSRVAEVPAPPPLPVSNANAAMPMDAFAQRRSALRREVAAAERLFRAHEVAAADPAPKPVVKPPVAPPSEVATQRTAIESKLDALFRALDRSAARMPDAEAPSEAASPVNDLAEPTASLLSSTTLSSTRTLDQAIAEISHKQAMLGRPVEARSARPAPAAPVAAPAAPRPDLLASLQTDIARMSNRLEAMHSDVTQRAMTSPVNDPAFEQIRVMLDRIRPDQSIDALERRVKDLTSKIDVALGSSVPAAAVEQLSQRIEHVHDTLKDRLSAPAAPPVDTRPMEEAVRDLVGSVRMLQHNGPDVGALEALMRRMSEKLDEERDPPVDARLFNDIQAQVGRLAERIDRSDAGLTAIVSVERSLGELFAQMEETRDAAIGAAETAARNAARDTLRSALSDSGLPFAQYKQTEVAVEQVTHDLADLRAAREAADQRLNAILGALNLTLEKVVDRLGALETDQAESLIAPAPTPAPPAAPAPSRVPEPPKVTPARDAGTTVLAKGPSAVVQPLAAAPRPRAAVAEGEPVAIVPPRRSAERRPAPPLASPIDDEADFLIEPGAAPARRALGRAPEVQSAGTPAPAAAGQPDPSTFIAAARRAAQSAAQAAQQDAERVPAAATAKARGGATLASVAGLASGLGKRRRPLLLALAGLVVLIGAVQVARLSLQTADTATAANTAAARPIATADMTSPVKDEAADQDAVKPAAAPAKVADATIPALDPVKPLPTLARGAAANLPAPPKDGVPAGLPSGLRNMAEDGSASAQFEVGLRLADGRGVTRDAKAAADWFEKAAKQGLAPAAYRLGSLYEKGMGVPRDAALAMQWYGKAADAGNIRAMHNLAVMSAEGAGGKSDYAKAASWFTKAALAGVRDSQFNLAILYARGLGIEQSLPQSYTWFSIAATQGDADAATKRDEVAGRLDAKALAEAKKNADNFQPAPTIAAANDVTPPPGGWDAVTPRPAGTPTSGLKADPKARVSSM